MASVLYPLGKEAFISGTIDLTTDDVRVLAYDTAVSGYVSTDQYVSDLNAGDIIARSAAMTSKTVALGVFDAADVTLSTVSGDPFEALVVYKYNASDAAAELIAYIDTGTGLPFTPSGGDITITWDSGANAIFAI